MKIRHLAAVAAGLVVACTAMAQEYAVPLGVTTLQSSSNFGRLRSTRFHSGVDLRTEWVEGKKVFAIADGQIYRIGVKPYGYGKVVYVMHNDGTVSAYGHLSEFTPEVDAYVRKERYRGKLNDIDIFPPAGTFPVKKGELIGLSGNSGNSFGPDLDFEVREKVAERTVNVLARGYLKIKDNMLPEIHKVFYYRVDTISGVPVHRLMSERAAVRRSDGSYSIDGQMELTGPGYFCIETSDHKNGVNSVMATYRILLLLDGKPYVEYLMDGFTFSQNHLAKIVSDYQLNGKTSNDVFRLAVVNDDAMAFYRNVTARGLVNPEDVSNVGIEVWDDNGNKVVMDFAVRYCPDKDTPAIVASDAEAVGCKPFYSKTTDKLNVTIPADALYEPIFYRQWKEQICPDYVREDGVFVLSDFYNVHSDDTPLRGPVTLSFGVDNVPENMRNKVVIARLGSNGRLYAGAAEYENGTVTGKAYVFGCWCVAADTNKPRIEAKFRSGSDMSNAKRIGFEISDNFSGVASYSAEIDGQWVMLEHDVVHGVLYHYFDDVVCGRGKWHDVRLTVEDAVGNMAVYTGRYYR